MATVNTNDLRIKNAKNLIDSFNDQSNLGLGTTANGYVFVGRVQPWDDDNLPPPPQNNFREFYTTYDDMLALSRIDVNDAYHMIPKRKWASSVIYDRYQHNYTLENRSYTGANNLYDCAFFVINSLNNVYICLDNNSNSPSTVEPNVTGNNSFYTSDGYQWLRLFDISNSDLQTKSTNNLMPIAVSNANSSQKDGQVYTVIINNGGSGYTVNPSGVVNQVTEYYAHINGDGTGAVAKVTIGSSTISKVEVVRGGSGYTFATLEFTSGNVYQTLGDLDLSINGLNPLGDRNLVTTVIISPPGGWGSDLIRQMGGTRVGVFSSLDYSLFRDNFPCPFRQIGILQDFTYSGTNPNSLQACYAINTDGVATGNSFMIGETIEQTIILSDGVTKKAKGTVVAYDTTNGVIRYVQGSSDVDADGELYTFQGRGQISGRSSARAAVVNHDNVTVSDTTFTNGYANPELTKYTGYMTYLTNFSPVVRDAQQSERLSLVIAF